MKIYQETLYTYYIYIHTIYILYYIENTKKYQKNFGIESITEIITRLLVLKMQQKLSSKTEVKLFASH